MARVRAVPGPPGVQGLGRPDEDTRGGFTHGGWGQRYNDEVMGQEMAKAMAKPGDMPPGRRTWQDFITAWGRLTDGNPVTTHMNAATKYVVSRTLEGADAWQNSILLRSDAVGACLPGGRAAGGGGDFHQCVAEEGSTHGGPYRPRLGEVPRVHGVEALEAGQVGEVDEAGHDVGGRAAGRREQCVDIAECVPGL